ncbi:HD domain-containing protein [Mesoplasma chauliocola]|uniref:HD domain-containing protein n=1 Tax=Mesoplasma chauliocola TaxID=216427 RepID=A0A249SN07_9MOLU|nr:HD domain-containing protein [Mesoplasma chauliocola]ASZ09003.1 HD domain-containing protein [Mesoplasma chauliocola]
MKKINELNNSIPAADLVVRLEKIIVSTATNGSSYLILNLSDKTGRIEARKWTVTEEDKQLLQPNAFVLFKNAAINEFRGVLQLKVNDYTIVSETELASYGLKSSDFFIEAPINIEKNYAELMTILEGLTNETYSKLTIGLIKKYEQEFLTYPAAMTIHHNVKGGLFWHSFTLVKNAMALRPSYSYASIDWELLICGAILHDIGKVIEIVDLTGTDYSLQGKVIGHISIGNTELNKIAEELNLYKDENGNINESLTLLQHMIIASHGKKEYGSPTEPVIIEAIMLSMFDDLDAKVFKINDELNKVEHKTWTPRIISVDGKMFYKHKK